MTEPHSIEFANTAHAQALFGHRDEHLAILADELTVDLHTRGTRVLVSGDPVDVKLASAVLRQIYDLISSGYRVSAEDFVRASAILQRSPSANLRSVFLDTIVSGPGGRRITPKTLTQKDYVDLMRAHDIVFGIGPAGTGKTYLAMAVAVSYLINKRVKRIILTRPAVEAGEKLGFLPGDMQEKISPYLRPLYDALHDMLDFERASQLLERGIVEVAPLAFMRGRTLNDAFVIFDEAQNSTREQMKMFLTRIGFGSKAVITGDVTQVDLERKERSGLRHAVDVLRPIDGIEVLEFSGFDVVRHPLVRRVISAYEDAEAQEEEFERAQTIFVPKGHRATDSGDT